MASGIKKKLTLAVRTVKVSFFVVLLLNVMPHVLERM